MKSLLNIVMVSLLCTSLYSAAACADGAKDNLSVGSVTFQSKDYKTSFAAFSRAAEQGNALAQYLLGNLYAKGQGVAQDDSQAVAWYRKAAEQGNALAQFNLGTMYAKGRGVAQDYRLAHMWYNIASSKGFKLAVENRDIIANRMTAEQISTAQQMAQEWLRKHQKP